MEFKNVEQTGNVAVIVTVAVVLVMYFTVLVVAGKADKVDARYVSISNKLDHIVVSNQCIVLLYNSPLYNGRT